MYISYWITLANNCTQNRPQYKYITTLYSKIIGNEIDIHYIINLHFVSYTCHAKSENCATNFLFVLIKHMLKLVIRI